ncbi:MAG: hypothetical protein J7J38_00470 [Candidatus Aenigmarchaeota archaeon]|nr:hypothetical protein [Candidatus Aenigmarchaeota archaeon]
MSDNANAKDKKIPMEQKGYNTENSVEIRKGYNSQTSTEARTNGPRKVIQDFGYNASQSADARKEDSPKINAETRENQSNRQTEPIQQTSSKKEEKDE